MNSSHVFGGTNDYYFVCFSDETNTFKGATKKFYQLFNMPLEEKLVNCTFPPVKVADA